MLFYPSSDVFLVVDDLLKLIWWHVHLVSHICLVHFSVWIYVSLAVIINLSWLSVFLMILGFFFIKNYDFVLYCGKFLLFYCLPVYRWLLICLLNIGFIFYILSSLSLTYFFDINILTLKIRWIWNIINIGLFKVWLAWCKYQPGLKILL